MLNAKKLQQLLKMAVFMVSYPAPVLILKKKKLDMDPDYVAQIVTRLGVN